MTNREANRSHTNHTKRHRNALDSLGRCNLNKRGGKGKKARTVVRPTAAQLAFRDLVQSGVEPDEARRLAGLPAQR